MTSHDVVQAIRRASGEQRVGHAGTLDPMATGVLVVCLGSATRVVEEVQQGLKGYRARVTLGASTSSYDAEGEIAILRAEHQLGPPTTETPSETGAAPPYQSP